MEIDILHVARVWDHLDKLGIYITHTEVQEELDCAFDVKSCSDKKKD